MPEHVYIFLALSQWDRQCPLPGVDVPHLVQSWCQWEIDGSRLRREQAKGAA